MGLPYAPPDEHTELADILAASSALDVDIGRDVWPRLRTYRWSAAQGVYKHGGWYYYCGMPVLSVESSMIGGEVADAPTPLGYRVHFDVQPANWIEVEVVAGWGERRSLGSVTGTWSRTLTHAPLGPLMLEDGQVGQIGSELVYRNGNATVRGAHGTAAVDHAPGSELYLLTPPADIAALARVDARKQERDEVKATDKAGEIGVGLSRTAADAAPALDRQAIIGRYRSKAIH